jgi:hypothetical protein
MAKGLFHVSMLVDANGLHAITAEAVRQKARDVNIQPVVDNKKNRDDDAAAPREARTPVRLVLYPFWLKAKQFSMTDLQLFGRYKG